MANSAKNITGPKSAEEHNAIRRAKNRTVVKSGRVITSAKRIEGIRQAVLRHMTERMTWGGKEIPRDSHREMYAKCLVGIEQDMVYLGLVTNTIRAEMPEYLPALQEAFVYGYTLVSDARLVEMPGASMEFFGPMQAKLQKNRDESRRERKQRKQTPARATSMGQALRASGHLVEGKEGEARILAASRKS